MTKLAPHGFHVRLGESHRHTPKIDVVTKTCCEKCNNGWMSALENKTKPILKPMMLGEIPLTLSPSDQVTLCRWIYKTALMGDFIFREKGHSPIPPTAYTAFYESGAQVPSQGVVIWTTAYADSTSAVAGVRGTLPFVGVSVDNKNVPRPEKWTAYLMTFTVFRAVFQVIGALGGWGPNKTSGEEPPYLFRLWPPIDRALVWPRDGLGLDTPSLDAFGLRTSF